MRTAAIRLTVMALAMVPLPLASAWASLLPQIDAARQYRLEAGLSELPISKHYVQVAPGVWYAVKGEKERRQVRFARWLDGLTGDRLAVYEIVGFPTNRHFENYAGDRTEHWLYADLGILYVFRGDMLVDVRESAPLFEPRY